MPHIRRPRVSWLSILDCSFGFLLTVSCVPNAARVSWLSILDCPFGFLLTVSCVPNVTSVS